MLLAFPSPSESSSSLCCGDLVLPSLKEAFEPPPGPSGPDPRARPYDPGPRAPRPRQRARPAAAVVRERGGVVDVPRPRVHPPSGGGMARRCRRRAPDRRRPSRRPRRTPTWSTRTSRSLPTSTDPGAAQRVTASEFPDETRPYGSSRLPDSDDVLREVDGPHPATRRTSSPPANMHLPGRQVDPKQVRPQDLWRLSQWEARSRPTPHAAVARRRRPRR